MQVIIESIPNQICLSYNYSHEVIIIWEVTVTENEGAKSDQCHLQFSQVALTVSPITQTSMLKSEKEV